MGNSKSSEANWGKAVQNAQAGKEHNAFYTTQEKSTKLTRNKIEVSILGVYTQEGFHVRCSQPGRVQFRVSDEDATELEASVGLKGDGNIEYIKRTSKLGRPLI